MNQISSRKNTAPPHFLLLTPDSESSEEEDRKTRKQEGKQRHQAEREEEEMSMKSMQGVKRRKSRLLIHTSAHQPLHLDLPKPRRESIRTMKLYRDSGERLLFFYTVMSLYYTVISRELFHPFCDFMFAYFFTCSNHFHPPTHQV